MSIIATALKHLIAAGVSGDDLVRAVAEMEEAQPIDRVAEKRRAYDRERKRAAKAANSTGIPPESVETAELSPSLDKEGFPQTPFQEINPIPVRETRARGTRLPIGWKPSKLSRETVSGQIIESRGQEWAKRSLESFENHWRAKSGKDANKHDWQATWANWVIEQDRRDGRNGRQLQQPANDGLGPTVRAALHAKQILDERARHV